MTPVLFLLSIGCYFVKSYPMFYVGMGISIIALIWIIWFQSKGKKFLKKLISYLKKEKNHLIFMNIAKSSN